MEKEDKEEEEEEDGEEEEKGRVLSFLCYLSLIFFELNNKVNDMNSFLNKIITFKNCPCDYMLSMGTRDLIGNG